MWEMQVLSSQRNNNKGDGEGATTLPNVNAGGMENSPGEDRLSGDGILETGSHSPHDIASEHPALRGVAPPLVDTNCPTEPMIGSPPANDSSEMSPNSTNGVSVGGAAAVGGGRKRPLLAGGPRTSMTPTKRTVMSLLARARAAQAKQLPTAFQRTTPERTPTLVPLLREDYITGAVNLNLI